MSGGKTTDELVETSRASLAPTGEQVFQGGAASILSDMLVSRVGSKLSLLGLDRNSVRIDPFVVGAQNSTTARITLSKQVTKELSVTYSQDLASNKQQIVQIEYFITRNISVLASKDENNVHGLDLRIRKRF
jgi:translocation and assembly module TamB